jgi:hypothetical protein
MTLRLGKNLMMHLSRNREHLKCILEIFTATFNVTKGGNQRKPPSRLFSFRYVNRAHFSWSRDRFPSKYERSQHYQNPAAADSAE